MSPSHPCPRLAATVVCALLLGACGGGGGGGGGAPAPATPPGETALGSRAMPDGVIRLSLLTPMRAGAEAVVAIEVPSTYPTVSRAEAGVATDAGLVTALSSAAIPVAPGRYQVAVTMPAQLPAGRRIFVRLVHGDGAVVESGLDDFHLP